MALELTGLADPPLQRLAFYAGAVSRPASPVYGASAGLTRPESACWLSRADAVLHWPQLASANYLASASLAAAVLGEGLLVDIGSTTSDLIVLRDGAVHSLGQGDAGRLASGELVYQGVVRTPLIALAQRVPFGAQTVHVMNELFATSADVYRLTGELAAAHDQQPPADGGAKTEAATCQRLARLLGRDAVDASPEQWRALAQHWRSLQLAELAQGLQSVIQAAGLGDAAPLVAAGCGAFLVADLARDLGRAALSFSVDVLGLAHGDPLAEWAQVCAPAVAVAILLPAAS
jgi:probable H4MPT-linked C1 transfer pathway protein